MISKADIERWLESEGVPADQTAKLAHRLYTEMNRKSAEGKETSVDEQDTGYQDKPEGIR